MFKKGRDAKNKPNGSCENHPRAKLKKSDILIIKREYSSGKSSRYLAKQFNVSKTMILNIVNNKNWRHLNNDKDSFQKED